MKRTSPKPPLLSRPGAAKAWSGERVYFRGDDYFRGLLRDLEGAKRSIDLESYIFEAGWLGDRVLRALLAAHRRGVRVRLLVDGVGSPDFASHYGPRLLEAGLPFKVYRSWPVFFSTAFRILRTSRLGMGLRSVRDLFNGGKHRDHRKLCVIDGGRVWIGSFNISDRHLERIDGKKAWRDTGLVLSGVRNMVFRMAFLIAWEDPWPQRRRRRARALLKRWVARDLLESPIRVTITRRMRTALRAELLGRMASARERIWVLSPYFSPTQALLRGLADGARRGLDVRLVLPGTSDVPMARWAAMNFYPYLLRAGCRIHEYQGRILHGKTLWIDDWVMAGSGNLDQRSLRKDLEVNVFPQGAGTQRSLEAMFRKDLGSSREVTVRDLAARPLVIRVLSWFFFRFRSWF